LTKKSLPVALSFCLMLEQRWVLLVPQVAAVQLLGLC